MFLRNMGLLPWKNGECGRSAIPGEGCRSITSQFAPLPGRDSHVIDRNRLWVETAVTHRPRPTLSFSVYIRLYIFISITYSDQLHRGLGQTRSLSMRIYRVHLPIGGGGLSHGFGQRPEFCLLGLPHRIFSSQPSLVSTGQSDMDADR